MFPQWEGKWVLLKNEFQVFNPDDDEKIALKQVKLSWKLTQNWNKRRILKVFLGVEVAAAAASVAELASAGLPGMAIIKCILYRVKQK